MDTRLLENLHTKLAVFEAQLRAYRRDMVTDFQRHCDSLLQELDTAAQSEYYRAIASSAYRYPTLRPELELKLPLLSAPSRPDSGNSAGSQAKPAQFQSFPPPAVFGDASAAGELHEREKEFQGLFTPSYLPLLDSSPPRSSSRSPKSVTCAPPAPPAAAVQATVDLASTAPTDQALSGSGAAHGVALGAAAIMDTPTDQNMNRALSPSASAPSLSRPEHVRHSTNDTDSSICSDLSESKIPKSALRRPSSVSRPPQSPRRVRFEFMGAEVLPTSSPQATDLPTPRPSSPTARYDAASGKSILDIEDTEPPPPRKISSSEALRALSRTPLEEGTVWTVVNSESESSSPDSESIEQPQPNGDHPSPRESTDEKSVSLTEPVKSRPADLGRTLAKVEGDDGDDDDSSDEDFLSMGKRKAPMKTKSQIIPKEPASNPPIMKDKPELENQPTDASPSPRPTPKLSEEQSQVEDILSDDGDYESEDEMFHFETGLSAPPKPREKPTWLKDAENGSVEEDTLVAAGEEAPASQPTPFGTSPAVPIPPRKTTPSGPSTPTATKFQPGSLGSYKGRPVVMPVVRDPEIYEQAASLGEFNTFVGGLDGRSGMDEGDLNSFRASVVGPSFNGTPRSFTERLMMEEANLGKGNIEEKSPN